MTAPSHQALYRSLPLVLGGLLGSLLLLVAGIAGVLPIVARDQRLPLVLGMLGVFVLTFAVCALTAVRRHRFAARLQAAMIAAGSVAPPVTDGLGFWNRPPGLALLSAAFLASLAVAAVVLWGLWEGEIRRVRTHEAAAFLVLLPIVMGWWLRRCWQRRRSVLRAMR